jgi:hypothetical protein
MFNGFQFLTLLLILVFFATIISVFIFSDELNAKSSQYYIFSQATSADLTINQNDAVPFDKVVKNYDNIVNLDAPNNSIEFKKKGKYRLNAEFYPTGDATVSEITLKYSHDSVTTDVLKQGTYNLASTSFDIILDVEKDSSLQLVVTSIDPFKFKSGELYSRWNVTYIYE